MAEESLSSRLIEIESMLDRSRKRFEEGSRLVEDAHKLLGDLQQELLGSPGQIGEEAFSRFFTAISYAEELHKNDMPEPHWYTMVLGVDPELQGHGYGPALMHPVFERSSIEGTPIYLETAQPKNVAFYEKLGFRVLRDVIEPSSGVRLWTFRREPGISPVN